MDKDKFTKGEPVNVKDKVMQKIQKGKIKMKSPVVFLAEKLGLESALIIDIILLAILVSIFSLFIEQTKIHKFLVFGFPGIKVFFITLPYDYIALSLIAIGLTFYLTSRVLSAYDKHNFSIDKMAMSLVALALFLGIIFILVGLDHVFKGWSQNKIPADVAISGKVLDLDFPKNEILLLDSQNHIIKLEVNKNTKLTGGRIIIKGKFLQAVGRRDESIDSYHFRADQINCCDER